MLFFLIFTLCLQCFIDKNILIRGDLANVSIGQFCILGESVSLIPGSLDSDESSFLPLEIGPFSTVGDHSSLSCARIGKCVSIESGCVIGERVIIHDFVRVRAGSVVPPDTVVPPFSIVGEHEERGFVGEEGEGVVGTKEQEVRMLYKMIREQMDA